MTHISWKPTLLGTNLGHLLDLHLTLAIIQTIATHTQACLIQIHPCPHLSSGCLLTITGTSMCLLLRLHIHQKFSMPLPLPPCSPNLVWVTFMLSQSANFVSSLRIMTSLKPHTTTCLLLKTQHICTCTWKTSSWLLVSKHSSKSIIFTKRLTYITHPQVHIPDTGIQHPETLWVWCTYRQPPWHWATWPQEPSQHPLLV